MKGALKNKSLWCGFYICKTTENSKNFNNTDADAGVYKLKRNVLIIDRMKLIWFPILWKHKLWEIFAEIKTIYIGIFNFEIH